MINFVKQVELQIGKPVRKIQSDNKTKFKNQGFEEFLTNKEISHKLSFPYTH